MPNETISNDDSSVPDSGQLQPERAANWRHRCAQLLHKGNPNYLLNLFTALLVASALIIMLVVGTAIYLIYSSAMIKNAENAAINVVNLIMSAEESNLIKSDGLGQRLVLIEPQHMERLDQQMRRYLVPFRMHKIKLYAPDKKIVYSTDARLIGKVDLANTVLEGVLRSGRAVSALERKKEFPELGGGLIVDAAIVEAYSPIFDAQHQVIGVFEVYVDITKTREAIFTTLMLSMTALGVVLGICLFSLYVPMKRGTLKLIIAHRELNDLATKDFLTGAYNRRYLADRVRLEWLRMRRQINTGLASKPIAFIMADIDFFKKINDSYGHAAGDLVLRAVASRLQAGLRQDYDVLCRYGGEEFLLMLPQSHPQEAVQVAERLRQCIVGMAFDIEGVGPVPITVSFGVATSNNLSESQQLVIERADHALYQAKERGRDRVVLADPQY